MDFIRTPLKEEFTIKKLISLHYFEYAKDYVFEGEKHDFWEFHYVDKGEVEIMSESNGYNLKQGDIIFHKPNEFHSVWANKIIAPNLIVISFECNSKEMSFFENKICALADQERNILAQIISEGFKTFEPPLNDPKINTLIKKQNIPFGAEQLIKIHLELLLISIIRDHNTSENTARLSSTVKERSEDDIVKRIRQYMNKNIESNITFNEICKFSNVSNTHLKTIFKQKTGQSVMQYFRNLKIERSKTLIREGKYNFTQIAEMLGYSSIHAFSKHFKRVTDMSPTEYSKSVKART